MIMKIKLDSFIFIIIRDLKLIVIWNWKYISKNRNLKLKIHFKIILSRQNLFYQFKKFFSQKGCPTSVKYTKSIAAFFQRLGADQKRHPYIMLGSTAGQKSRIHTNKEVSKFFSRFGSWSNRLSSSQKNFKKFF